MAKSEEMQSLQIFQKAQEDFVKIWNPSLFIITEEALSRGLSYLFQKGLVGFYECGRSSLFIAHLSYADKNLTTNIPESVLETFSE
jgi:hypothetical protein